MTDTEGLVKRQNVFLRPNPDRVVAQLFVAGEELSSGGSRASTVMERVLALGDEHCKTVLDTVLSRFQGRHPDLQAILLEDYDRVRYRLESEGRLSPAQRMLLGAYATNEFSVEAAALCNPSIVAHPDQTGVTPGELRFVLSLRAVGEGHISSIEFRTGTLDSQGSVCLDDPGPFLFAGRVEESSYDAVDIKASLGDILGNHEIVRRVLSQLPAKFTGAELDDAIGGLHRQGPVRREAQGILEKLRTITSSNYIRSFPPISSIGQRVIRPFGPAEINGMEDARFVRFTDEGGEVNYLATYTAFDGSQVIPRLIKTDDFARFEISEMTGRAATNKGMALFPRRIAGRFVALSRWDRERIALATSTDRYHWSDPQSVYSPTQSWELTQVGNCGSPIETPEGWLVLTHGVGPMRTYSIGAMLLDLEDPTRVVASLTEPLLAPNEAEREGYVPNVVYSCGSLVLGQTLIMPYAFGDRVTTFASVSLPDLLAALK